MRASPSHHPLRCVARLQYELLISLAFSSINEQNNLFIHGGDPPMSFFGCYFDPLVQYLSAVNVSRCTFTNVDVRTLIPVSALPTNGTTYYITVLDATATPNTFQVGVQRGSPRHAVASPVRSTRPDA